MDAILHTLAIYLFLLVVFRLSGKRSLGQVTTFDFILLLIIGEATQQALLGQDASVTHAYLVILTLLSADIGLSLWKQRSPRVDKLLEGIPLVIVEHGRPLQDRMERERVDVQDVLQAARSRHGLERLEEIKFAILERNGEISIIPRRDTA